MEAVREEIICTEEDNEALDSLYAIVCTLENLASPATRMFENNFAGVLSENHPQSTMERYEAAYHWMDDNYDLLSGIVFAVDTLSTMAREKIESIEMSRIQ